MKKIILSAIMFIMVAVSGIFTIPQYVPAAEQNQAEERNGATINTKSVTLYGLDSWAEECISIPSGYKTSFKLSVSGASGVQYKVKSGNSVTVSSDGTITPVYETWYWYGGMGSTSSFGNPDEEVEKTGNYGNSVILVTAGSQSFEVKVSFLNYAEVYTDSEIDKYIKSKIITQKTDYNFVNAICSMPAHYKYSASVSGAISMVVTEGGNCWASTALIIRICDRLKSNYGYDIESWTRNGNKDAGAGSGHMNAMVEYHGVYYELEAGYGIESPDRYYTTKVRESLFSIRGDYENKTVTIYQYDGQKTDNMSLVIPKTITISGTTSTVVGLDKSALAGMSTLTSIKLPDTLESIGDFAFSGCTALKSIVLPKNVKTVGIGAFAMCDALTSITCDSANPYLTASDNIVMNKSKTEVYSINTSGKCVIPSTVKSIGEYAAYYNYGLTSVTIPQSVTSIGEGAFGDCSNIESVTIEGKGLKTIGDYAFYYNEKLTSIRIPSSVTSIGKSAVGFIGSSVKPGFLIKGYYGTKAEKYAKDNKIDFVDASTKKGVCGKNLTYVLDGEVITISGTGAMYNYEKASDTPWYASRAGITKIVIGKDVTTIGNNAFYGFTKNNRVWGMENVVSIGTNAFRNNTSLYIVDGCTKVKTVGSMAFCNANNLKTVGSVTKTVKLPSAVTIKNNAFSNCRNFTDLKTGGNLTTIENYAFQGCTSLKTAYVGSKCTTVGPSAFMNDKALEKVSGMTGVTTIGACAFKNCQSLSVVEGCQKLTSLGQSAFNCAYSLSQVGNEEATVKLPLVTAIGKYAFYYCERFKKLTVTSATTFIGDNAFRSCSWLETVSDLYGVTTIGDNAFRDCIWLMQIGKCPKLSKIGDYAFYNCGYLITIGVNFNEYTLTKVTTIGKNAFGKMGCDLYFGTPGFVFGSGLTSVGEKVFYGMNKSNVYVPTAKVAQYKKLFADNGNITIRKY